MKKEYGIFIVPTIETSVDDVANAYAGVTPSIMGQAISGLTMAVSSIADEETLVGDLRGALAMMAVEKTNIDPRTLSPDDLQALAVEAWSSYLLASIEESEELEREALKFYENAWRDLVLRKEDDYQIFGKPSLDTFGFLLTKEAGEWIPRDGEYKPLQGADLLTLLPEFQYGEIEAGNMVIVVDNFPASESGPAKTQAKFFYEKDKFVEFSKVIESLNGEIRAGQYSIFWLEREVGY